MINLDEIINRIAKETLNSYCMSPAYWSNPIAMGLIKESLTRSYPPEKTLKWVRKYIGYDNNELRDWIKIVNDEQHGVTINVVVDNRMKHLDFLTSSLLHGMQVCGWSQLGKKDVEHNGINYTIYIFEPKFKKTGVDVSQYKCLYHMTPKDKVNKIMQIGLCPKTTNSYFSYPNRVYFFYPDTPEMEYYQMAIALEDGREKNGCRPNDTYVLLSVDLQSVKKDVKFHEDASYAYGLYTQDNIPPRALSVITEVPVLTNILKKKQNT